MSDDLDRELRWYEETRFGYHQTFRVELSGKPIGAIQCDGPCRGIGAKRNHPPHGPWLAFVGPVTGEAMLLPEATRKHDTERGAAEAVVRAYREAQNAS